MVVAVVLALLFCEESVGVVVLIKEKYILLTFSDGGKKSQALGLFHKDGDLALGVGTEVAYHDVALRTHVLHAVVYLNIEALTVLAGDDGGEVSLCVAFLLFLSGLCHCGESEEAEGEE